MRRARKYRALQCAGRRGHCYRARIARDGSQAISRLPNHRHCAPPGPRVRRSWYCSRAGSPRPVATETGAPDNNPPSNSSRCCRCCSPPRQIAGRHRNPTDNGSANRPSLVASRCRAARPRRKHCCRADLLRTECHCKRWCRCPGRSRRSRCSRSPTRGVWPTWDLPGARSRCNACRARRSSRWCP